MKNGKWMNLFFIFCSGITGFVFMILLYALFDIFGSSNSTNQATIFSGLLSLFGGAGGATAAYLIARMQMTKQLDLQFEKEKHKLILELEIGNVKRQIQLISSIKYHSESLKYLIRDLQKMFEEINGKGREIQEWKQQTQVALKAIELSREINRQDYLENYQSSYEVLDSIQKYSIEEYNKNVSDFNQTFRNGKDILREIQSDLSKYLSLELIQEKGNEFFDRHKKIISKVVENYSKEINEQSIKNLSEKVPEIEGLINYQTQELIKQTTKFKENITNYRS